jgi:hypothetical protein
VSDTRPTTTLDPERLTRPWRPRSFALPAAAGGPVVVGVLGFLNARRLGMPTRTQVGMAVAGALGLAAYLALVVLVRLDGLLFARAGTGAVVFLAVYGTQELAFDRYRDEGGEPASLWLPGTLAVVVARGAEFLLASYLAVDAW